MLSELNIALTLRIMKYLGIQTPVRNSIELGGAGKKTDRVIQLLKLVGATSYLSGPSADAYLDKAAFSAAGIGLEYKSYDYAPYPQQGGDFVGQVSVLDLIANCGPDAAGHLRSRSPNIVVL